MRKKPKAAKAPPRKTNNKPSPVIPNASADGRPISIVGIGASAGGLEAFEQLLHAVRNDTGMAFVLVQHLAPKHESILSELLGKATSMPVVEVQQGMSVRSNHVYVIPPNADMTISDGTLHLAQLPPDRARRMPIDHFLRSLAEAHQNRSIGVILSGTASDGTLGLQAIKAMGGVTFAQDEQSAKYGAMPRNAVAAGSVDFVLPPQAIAQELTRIANHVHVFAPAGPPEADEALSADETLNSIFRLLRNVSRVDFTYYKPGTVKRRITRRMFLRKIEGLQNYLQFLRRNRDEVDALFNDILINVTGFFRDPESFENLKKTAFPAVMKQKTANNSTIRIWVPGCSTGEEAYSLAIVLLEYLGEKSSNLQVQIFATDVSDNIINKARVGIYPESIAMDMSADRLRRFFQKVESGYQIHKSIRDMCVFAKQDLSKDPPFSKLDMISCRNVMIYMSQVLQKRILPLFHYALNSGGILMLGSSETVGSFDDLFTPLDKKHRIYTKNSSSGSTHFDFVPRFDSKEEIKPKQPAAQPQASDLNKIAEQMLLHRFAPASVMVTENMDIVQFIGQTGRFLDPAPGDASLNLMRMVKTGLHLELRVAFQKARRDGAVRKEGVLIEHDSHLKSVNFEILPVKNIPGQRFYLVVFEDSTAPPSKSQKGPKEAPNKKSVNTKMSSVESENKHLKEELEATREYLQSIIEEQRTTNEELRSANEEIQSSNEELQSINEELETAKEELQSTNEELTTVNEELRNRNDELSVVNGDLNNLLSSVSIPIVMLGNDLRIRRFTPPAETLMNLISSDVGRPITDIKPNVPLGNLKQTIVRVIESLEIHEKQVEDNDGKWYSMKIRPYRTLDNKIDGVVVVFLELDPRLRPAHTRKS